MNQKLFQLNSLLTYWLDAVEAHSLQSPFLFDLYTNVISVARKTTGVPIIESIRKELLNDDLELEVQDMGSGSNHFESYRRRIADIARTSLSPLKYSMLYRLLIEHFGARQVLELGTSLGINSLYLAYQMKASLYTFEGSAAIAGVARKQFERCGCNNIAVVEGNIDEMLSKVVSGIDRLDFALIDANHRYDPTIRYFQTLLEKVHRLSIIVMDDIHYSEEMQRAWDHIRSHDCVYASVDLYRCGLLFFDPSLSYQQFVLEF